MTNTPSLRVKLESAVRTSQQNSTNLQKAKNDTENQKLSSQSSHKPSIQLKTDFSNFQ